jgi:hypothetical protein
MAEKGRRRLLWQELKTRLRLKARFAEEFNDLMIYPVECDLSSGNLTIQRHAIPLGLNDF